MILFRPVGPIEMALILESNSTRFPPRLPDQPIFYPVMNFEYAEQIARDWNATSGNFAGFVTRFEVDDAFISRYDEQVVGSASVHRELWVPAEELDEFNRHIRPPIEIVACYYGTQYRGDHGTQGLLAGLTASEQWQMLAEMSDAELLETMTANTIPMQLNVGVWRRDYPSDPRLARIQDALY